MQGREGQSLLATDDCKLLKIVLHDWRSLAEGGGGGEAGDKLQKEMRE